MRLFGLACALVLSSCGDDDCCEVKRDAAVLIDAPDSTQRVEVARLPVAVNRDVDLLFVIDDSVSTIDMQNALKASFPAFITELAALEGGLPNVHIGVVTTDLGTKGAEDAQPGPDIGTGPGACSGLGKNGNLTTNNSSLITGNFISDIKAPDATRTTNYTGTLANAFSAAASVGSSGCGFEQHLEAAKRALDNNPANAGFLRPNAKLAIIVTADEDDCSIAHSTLFSADTATFGPLGSFRCTRFGITCDVGGETPDAMNQLGIKDQCHSNEQSAYLTHVEPYATYFKGLKPDPNDVLFAALIGDSTPVEIILRTSGSSSQTALKESCTWTTSNGMPIAVPGVRIAQLASRFAHNTVTSVCGADHSAALTQFARQVRGLVGDSCLTRTIAMPFDCIVTDEVGTVSTVLPACSSTVTTDCYRLVSDPATCTLPGNLKLQIMRSQAPAPQTVVVARCLL